MFYKELLLQRKKGSVQNRVEIKKALNKNSAFQYKLIKFQAYETSLTTVFLYWFDAVKGQVPKN